MAKQTINIGASPNDGTGTPLRTSFDYCNLNFTELYTATGPSGNNIVVPGTATITGDLTVDTSTLKVDSGTNNVSIGGLVNKVTGVSGSGTGLTIQASAAPTLGIWDTTDPSYFTNLTQVDANCYLYNNAAGALLFGTNNTERYRIASDGVATWSGVGGVAGTAMTLNSTANLVLRGGTAGANGVGVTFPAVQVASSDANCLDDYEEGTWTGTLAGGTTNPTTPVTVTGRYTKIGREVSIQIQFTNVDTTGASGQIQVTGAPFTNNSSTSSTGSVLLSSIATFTGSPAVFIGVNTTVIELYASSSGGAAGLVTHNAGASRSLYINLTYTV
jgi:hypothetical protein